MAIQNFNIKGLTNEEVIQSKTLFGTNILKYKKENSFLDAIKSLAKLPMVSLLLVASIIYFIFGDIGDGLFLAAAIILLATISLYQDAKSKNALEKLQIFIQPNCKVIRNGILEEIKTEDLVIGDCLMIEEGVSIAADIFLTLVNRSFYYSILTTIQYKNNLVGLIILITILVTGLLLYVPVLAGFFKFAPLKLTELLICIGIGFISVIWYEVVKFVKRQKNEIEKK